MRQYCLNPPLKWSLDKNPAILKLKKTRCLWLLGKNIVQLFFYKEDTGTFSPLLVAHEVIFPVVVISRFLQIESVPISLIFNNSGPGLGSDSDSNLITMTLTPWLLTSWLSHSIRLIKSNSSMKISTRGDVIEGTVIRANSVLTPYVASAAVCCHPAWLYACT